MSSSALLQSLWRNCAGLTLTALFALYTWKLYPTSSGTVVLLKSYGMMSQHLSQKRYSNFILHFENVVFGYFIQDNVNNKAFVINLFVLLVKFHIHRCKFSNRKPCFTVFYKELESYFCAIQSSTNRKAIKTVSLCSVFKIFE